MRILIVDDDHEMGALIQRGLAAEGYETTVVDNGISALIAVQSAEIALAAIDVMLPGMSGFEICRRIRQDHPTMPILLLTARDAVEDRVFGLDSGADDYLTKPFAFVELNARIRALLRRENTSDPRVVITAGKLRLDSLTLTVHVGEVPIGLSPKEFSFLRLLAGQVGQFVSRSTILEAIWGSAENIDPNIVDQYVSYLRRKLDAPDAGARIVTKRGVGYALEVVP
jgi:two-component system OmpR family response regulator